MSLDYTNHRMNSTKRQTSVTATLNTLIHNKLTQRYLTVHNCIISS